MIMNMFWVAAQMRDGAQKEKTLTVFKQLYAIFIIILYFGNANEHWLAKTPSKS